MAKKKSGALYEVVEEKEEKPRKKLVRVEGDEDDNDDLAQRWHQLKDGEKVSVFRWNSEERDWEHLGSMNFDKEWDLGALKKWVIGPSSKFKLKLLDDEGHYVASQQVRVANPEWSEKPAAAAPPAPPDPLQSPTFQMMLKQMEASHAQFTAIVTAMVGRPQQREQDPLDMMVKLKSLFPQEKPTSLKDQLELFMMTRELMGENGDKSWVSEIKEGLGLVHQVSTLVEKKRAAGGQPAALPAAGKPVANPPQLEKEPAPVNDPIHAALLSYVPILVRKAQRAADIEDTAQFVLDEVESEIMPLLLKRWPVGEERIWQELVDGSKDKAKLEQLFLLAPELAAFREWVEQVVGRAVELHEASDATDTVS